MLVSYYPKEGKEQELLALIEKHWPTLDRVGLVSKMPPQVWRATDKRTNRRFFVEMFQWRDDQASEIAHRRPGVMAIWEPMGPILDSMQPSRIEPIPLPFATTQRAVALPSEIAPVQLLERHRPFAAAEGGAPPTLAQPGN